MSEITELIPQQNNDCIDYQVDQTIISNELYLPKIYHSNFKENEPQKKELFESFAKPSIFYPFTEDFNYQFRIKHIKKLTHDISSGEPGECYSDADAETAYLSSTPVSYVIVGKPDIGESELSRLISDYWKCVYISPDSVIREEILSGSRAGKCIEYNLKSGRAVGPEVILRLVEKRIKTQTAHHRGFVISGFPMLPNNNYKEDPISSESAVFNAEEIFEDLLPPEVIPDRPGSVSRAKVSLVSEKSAVSEAEDAEDDRELKENVNNALERPKETPLEDILDLGSSSMNIIRQTESFYLLSQPETQFTFLLSLLKQPFVIIYIMSSNLDVVSKRDQYRFDISMGNEIVLPFIDEDTDTPLDDKENVTFMDGDQYAFEDYNDRNRAYKVRLPLNFKPSISDQIRQYRCRVHCMVEEAILNHDPQHFIKVDGRLSMLRIFTNVRLRLKTLAFQPVLIPEKLANVELGDEGETPALKIEDQPVEETFNELRSRLTVGPMYKWKLSNWEFKCPVALKEGRIVNGISKNAVKFMNKIFYLSDDEALVKFYRNPRLYLQPVSPEPTCRIWIFGPPQAGKSLIALTFSLLYSCKILQPQVLENEYKMKKEEEFIENVRTAAITEGLVAANERRILEREEHIEQWQIRALELLELAVKPKSEMKLEPEDNLDIIAQIELLIIPTKPVESTLENIQEETLENFYEHEPTSTEALEYELYEMNLPTQLSVINDILNDPEKLMSYLPLTFTEPLAPATIFDTFVTQFVNDVIDITTIPDMTLTLEEKIDMFKISIENAENAYYDNCNRLGGWVIDGMLPDLELIKALVPDFLADDIFCLNDFNTENKIELRDFIFARSDFHQLFTKLKRPSIVAKIPTMSLSRSRITFKSLSSGYLVNNMSTDISVKISEKDLANLKQLHKQQQEQFHSEWENVQGYFDENEITPIVINTFDKLTEQMLTEAYITYANRYRSTASILTEEQRNKLVSDYGGRIGTNEEEYGEDAGLTNSADLYLMNRRLGNTNIYCPIAFSQYFVLWKGKENFTVQFEDQLYFLSSEHAMSDFLTDPRLFLSDQPIALLPPPRICIIGVPGTGKTLLAQQLANNFGINYISFDSLIMESFQLPVTNDMESVLRLDATFHEELKIFPERIGKIRKYIENDVTFPDNLIQYLLSKIWFDNPCFTTGFVLDNFPRRLSDVDILLSNYFIPDIVIEINASRELVREICYQRKFQEWRTELDEKQLKKQQENDAVLDEWQQIRYDRFCYLSEQKRKQRIRDRKRKLLTTPVDSNISLKIIEDIAGEEEYALEDFVYEFEDEAKDMHEINNILDEELPQPVFNDVWESEDEAKERIERLIDSDYSREIEFLDEIRERLKNYNIDCVTVEMNHMFREAIRVTDQIKFRNQSLFERVYEITIPVADRLIDEGYYFLSRFGRTCPVQVYENYNTIQMFLPADENMNVFPVIHRRYVYFIVGEKSLDNFKYDPLKYTTKNKNKFPLIPVKIAIIGPPKSGKSILADRFQKEFDLKIITRGNALRYVLQQFPTCDLAKHIRKIIKRGWSPTNEMVAKAVEALTLDGKSISQGYVLDGFPTSQDEMKYLIALGIVPHIVLNIQTTVDKIKEFTNTETDHDKYPPYSFAYIKLRYDEWRRAFKDFRTWLEKDYQNVCNIQNDDNKWDFWDHAKQITLKRWLTFKDYTNESMYDQVFSLKTFCVTSAEFFERESLYRNYCPLCYTINEVLNQQGKYPDRNCVVQYLRYFYFICYEHQYLFDRQPLFWIPPKNTVLLPKHLPVIVNDNKKKPYYQDGLCIVSFWDNQPNRVLVQGLPKFMVLYISKYYIFCSAECLDKFMKLPQEYFDKLIRFRDKDPLILSDIRNMPIMGYLEQYASKLLIEAVINTEINRPFHPGMSVSLSAILNVALYLKCKNSKTPKEILPMYEEARRKFHCRRKQLKIALDFFKNRMNPFVYVPELPRKKTIEPEPPADKTVLEFHDIGTVDMYSDNSSLLELNYAAG